MHYSSAMKLKMQKMRILNSIPGTTFSIKEINTKFIKEFETKNVVLYLQYFFSNFEGLMEQCTYVDREIKIHFQMIPEISFLVTRSAKI